MVLTGAGVGSVLGCARTWLDILGAQPSTPGPRPGTPLPPGQGGAAEQGVEQREEHGEVTCYQLHQLFAPADCVTYVKSSYLSMVSFQPVQSFSYNTFPHLKRAYFGLCIFIKLLSFFI